MTDDRHRVRHLIVAAVTWLVAVFLIAWFFLVAPSGAARFLLLFAILVVSLALLGASVAVWFLRPSLIRGRLLSRALPPAPRYDALGRPPVEVAGPEAVTRELVLETGDDGRRRLRARGGRDIH